MYFKQGYQYDTILKFLSEYHNYNISLSTLIRRLKDNGLKRRNQRNSFNKYQRLERVVANEIRGPNSLLGYRLMWNMLKERHGIYITRASVRKILKDIDPEGVEARLRHRLKRRKYRSARPNFCWHLDGYDKLKPYGFFDPQLHRWV